MRRASLLLALAAILATGCDSGSHTGGGRLSPRESQELRFAAEQASLRCETGLVVKWNLRTARRECVTPTPAEVWAAVKQLLARCHGESEEFVWPRFVGCVKR